MADPKHEFQRGDRVRGKATGRTMTVVVVYQPLYVYRYRCEWEEDGRIRSDLFRRDQLEMEQQWPPLGDAVG